MLLVAIGWQMYDLTGSAWDLGLVGLRQFLPALALVLVAGRVVDRHHRARIVALCLGTLLMSVVLTRWPIVRHAGAKLFAAVAVFGLATLAFGLSTSFVLSLLALVAAGAADMVSVVIRQTMVQLETPDAMRGRVSAVASVFIGASNQLGELESGAVAAWLGPVGSVLIGGAGTLLVAARWWRWFPSLARRDALVQAETPPPPASR